MIIAEHLKEKNIAEYVLYMWQVEDIIRAYRCDFDLLKKNYLSRFDYNEETMLLNEQWYANLCSMMISEGVQTRGHLSVNKATLSHLEDLNNRLLSSDSFPYYKEMYDKVLPYIVELRAKESEDQLTGELETCFNALYGKVLLRLQQKDVSAETQKALDNISTFLGQLSDYYAKDSNDSPIA